MSNNSHELKIPAAGRLVELTVLLDSIEGAARELGEFTEVLPKSMPVKFQQLLAHNEHMTVAVEAFHGCPVTVQVLQSRREDSIYVREILLRRSTDQQVVQYGIVRLQLEALNEAPRQAILSEKIPLGRVLIEHNVLREVELVDLWKIVVGPKLAELLHVDIGSITYGRTAMIYFSNRPALELLEIVI
jgi:chorismate-pyruvate lyase